MSRIVYIGIDDTDNLESVGTGRVARSLGAKLEAEGLGRSLGVSRHQLLVHPDIRYTSHNSSKGLAIETCAKIEELLEASIDHLKDCYQPGSDPGLCICEEGSIQPELHEYASSAEKEVLTKQQAFELAQRLKIELHELGGDGSGIIGALAAVGLRSTGNNGRLVEVKGIRDLKGILTVKEILERSDIDSVQDINGKELEENETINSLDWIRPSLINWKAVLKVVQRLDENNRAEWVPAEKAFKPTGGKK